MISGTRRLVAIMLVVVACAPYTAGAQLIRPLIPAGGAEGSYAQSVNDAGVVVGYSDDWPTVWRPTSDGYVGELLPMPSGDWSIGGANSVAHSGIIAGYVQPPDGETATAVVWSEASPGGGYSATPLPWPVGAVMTGAYAVNSGGHVAGFAENAAGNTVGIVWSPQSGGGYDAVALTASGFSTVATAINDAGDIASYVLRNPITSVIWSDVGGGYNPHTVFAADAALVTAISPTGVGAGVYANQLPLVMVYYEGDYYAFHLPVPFQSQGASNGVNSFDAIVGTVKDTDTPQIGFEAALWVPTDSFWDYVNLNQWLAETEPVLAAHWTLLDAWGVNDEWLVTGHGLFDPDGAGPLPGVPQAFVLDISALIPEPTAATWLVVASLLLRRRRNR